MIDNIITVKLPDTSYDIFVGSNILKDVGKGLKNKRVLIISNPLVYGLYGTSLTKTLDKSEVHDFLIPDGEKYKTIDTVSGIYDFLLEKGFDRQSFIVALGGGVIGDIAGFVASTYMRGIGYIHVPTTLLAQVDSSIGGKVAINHPKGKNIIGSFYQPRCVYSDVKTLETLPGDEFINGMAEVIKYSLIKDEKFFELLEKVNPPMIKKKENLLKIVSTCAQIKTDIVEKDEKENGIRAILNFGHTIGHAIETVTEYRVKHGMAVSLGMVAAVKISTKKRFLEENDEIRILNLIRKYNLPTHIEEINVEKIYCAMKYDKKITNNKIRFVLLKSIGETTIRDDVDKKLILASLNEMKQN